MTSPAHMGKLQFGVTGRAGQCDLGSNFDGQPQQWADRRTATAVMHALTALYPDGNYRLTTRRHPCPPKQ